MEKKKGNKNEERNTQRETNKNDARYTEGSQTGLSGGGPEKGR